MILEGETQLDIATLVGVLGGSGVVLFSMILAGSLIMFWDFPSLVIVIGGSIFAVMMRWPMSGFMSGAKASLKVLFHKGDSPVELIKLIVELADTARKGSLLALEKVEIENKYLAKAVRFLVDGYEADVINGILAIDIAEMDKRHKDGRGVMENMGEASPAMGMIGTVIGLIVIMANISDPSKIGPGLAVALVTTLYGALFANMFFIPFAQKLKFLSEEEVKNLRIIKVGVNGLIAGENPRTLQEKLASFLPPGVSLGEDGG